MQRWALAVGAAAAALVLLRRDRSQPLQPPAPTAPAWDWTTTDLAHLSEVDPRLVRVMDRARELSEERFAVLDGRRTEAEQRGHVSRGTTRCNPDNGCVSYHLTGHALDVAPLDSSGRPEQWDRAQFAPLAATIHRAATELGIPVVWGGNWPEPQTDVFHWQVSR